MAAAYVLRRALYISSIYISISKGSTNLSSQKKTNASIADCAGMSVPISRMSLPKTTLLL